MAPHLKMVLNDNGRFKIYIYIYIERERERERERFNLWCSIMMFVLLIIKLRH